MILTPRRKFWFLCSLMLVLELLIAWFILSTHGFNFYQGGDSPGYMLLAKNLAEHGTLSFADGYPYHPTNFRTPGYPLFLALVYLIFDSFVPAIFFGAFISAFAAPLIYLIAKEIFSEKIAFGAGILTAVEPMGLFLGVSILTEGVFTPILFLTILYFVRYLKMEGHSYLWYSAALLGAATLIRPIAFYFWPLAVIFIFYKTKNLGWRPVLKAATVFVAIFFLVLSPWLVSNKISVNSWQITGFQGYIFFIDHYGAVLRYLGEAGSLSDVQSKALVFVKPDKIFTSEGSDILFKAAASGIKGHKLAYANVYAKSLISFFIANGYKSLFIDILGIPAKASYIPFELFLRFNFKSIFKTFSEMDFNGILIYWGSKIFWIIISGSFFATFLLLFKNRYKNIRAQILFLVTVIFYFALITGPTVINSGGRTKASVNGLMFIFFVFGISTFLERFKRRNNAVI